MTMFSLTNLICFLVYVLSTIYVRVEAAPLAAFLEREVFDPRVTNPDQGSVWNVGEQKTVTWDTSILPQPAENITGTLVLGFLSDDSPGEHLMLDSPLASGFSLYDGKVEVTVPNVPGQDRYIVVLMGDSGNASPEFTIRSASSAGGAGGSVTALTSTISTPVPITGNSITGGATTATATSPASATPTLTGVSTDTLSTVSAPVSSSASLLSTPSAVAASAAAASGSSVPNSGSIQEPNVFSAACIAMVSAMLVFFM